MTAANSLPGASSIGLTQWDFLPWQTIEKQVKRLQIRIAKAHREGRKGKVKALQRLLTHSFYAKCLAVRRVTQNKGAKTPGIDGVLWSTSLQRWEAVKSLKRQGYTPKPLKRIYIPKKGKSGRLRPLSIPCKSDRAMQALYLLALEPIVEERADPNSYGFRPKRGAADALEQCHIVLSKRYSPPWILEGDIKSCFDCIDTQWLLENIPMDKTILGKFLKAGYIDKGQLHPTLSGVPQGGLISAACMVMTLSGLETELKQRFKRGTKVNLISYADDFIITGATLEILESEVMPVVQEFLGKRGLTLSPEKTKITHIEAGFDFLGHNVRKYKDKLLTKPSKASVKAFLQDVRETIKSLRGAETVKLIHALNPKIRGWCMYFRHACSAKTFSYIDYRIYETLAQWIHRRHTRKSRLWCRRLYFKRRGSRNWVFSAKYRTKDQQIRHLDLVSAAAIPIKRHIKIRGIAHPFDPKFKEYFEARDKGKVSRRPDCHKTVLSKA